MAAAVLVFMTLHSFLFSCVSYIDDPEFLESDMGVPLDGTGSNDLYECIC